jgi:signal transduction histidine kinase
MKLPEMIKDPLRKNPADSGRQKNFNWQAKMPWLSLPPATQDSELPSELHWFVEIERAAVIPSKWMLLALGIVLSVLESDVSYPPLTVFTLFAFYALSNLIFSYVFYLRRYLPGQIRKLEYLSLSTDIVVISLYIYLSTIENSLQSGQADFYLLYFLVILRGVVLFPTRKHTLLMNTIISGSYIITVLLSQKTLRFLTSNDFLIRLVLLWGLMLMSWFVVEIVRIQREKLQEGYEHIQKMEAHLIRTERLASMGEIAAGVAHEINNPVGIIMATSDLLLRKIGPEDPSRPSINIIAGEAERCKKIVSEMMALSTPSKIKTEKVSVTRILRDCMEMSQEKTLASKIEVETHFEEELPLIEGNPTLLQRVFLNLINNALQAMPDGGKLQVGVKFKAKENEITTWVSDTGKGIPAEDQDKIFTPFYTTKTGQPGLGLTVTHRIVDWHRGQITIESKPEKGTRFEISLPVNREPEEL